MVILKDLNEYVLLLKEVKDLEKRMQQHSQVTDIVTGSSAEPPYTKHPISITGFSCRYNKRMHNRYSRQVQILQQKIEEIEDRIASIDDSLVRQGIRLYYIDRLPWTKVAIRIGGGNTADGIRMAVKRYFLSQQ